MASFGYQNGLPGNSALYQTVERNVVWWPVPGSDLRKASVVVSSAAVDAGSTPTTYLRPGLIVGKLDSGGEYVAYDADATDGSQEAAGVIVEEVNTLDPATGAGADRFVVIAIGGGLIAGELIGLDAQARAQLVRKGFIFDDGNNPRLGYRRIVEKGANYTVVAADSGVRFAAITGAVTFTLPTIAVGLHFEFLNTVDANMTITSAEGENVLTDNNATADGVVYSTASHKIGALCRVEAVYIGGVLKWVPANLTPTNTMTITDA